jgi:hypothetical protein
MVHRRNKCSFTIFILISRTFRPVSYTAVRPDICQVHVMRLTGVGGGESTIHTIFTAILGGYNRNFRQTQLGQTCREDLHHAQLKPGRRVQSLRETMGPRASSRLPIQLMVLFHCLHPAYTLSPSHFKPHKRRSPQRLPPNPRSHHRFQITRLPSIICHPKSQTVIFFTHICIVFNNLDIDTPHISC